MKSRSAGLLNVQSLDVVMLGHLSWSENSGKLVAYIFLIFLATDFGIDKTMIIRDMMCN